LPGVRRNYCTDVQILGYIQENRECFTWQRIACQNAENIRLCKVLLAGPKATKRGFIARAHAGSIAGVFKASKRIGPFIHA